MPILPFEASHLAREYGIMCQRVFPRPDLATPFGATYCRVAPGEATLPHQHHEGETFYIARGRGSMAIEGESEREVGPGDVVYLPAHARHTLRNDSKDELLEFFSVWWDDGTAASRDLPARSLVFVAPPTPNGDLHLGHLSGPYVAADVHARYLRARRVDARYLAGSDDNQSYVAVKASRLDTTPEAVTERFGDANENTLRAVGVAVAHFIRPTRTPAYGAFVQQFFERLAAQGALERREAASLWCTPCDRYLYEAHVSGGCPHCGAPTNGNGCEACYMPNDCVDLAHPVCNRCLTPATVTTRTRWYFPLGRFRDRLAAYYPTVAMSPHLRALAEGLLVNGLPDISVSHEAGWGIPVPLDGFAGQVIYEWFEMAAGFLYAAQMAAPPELRASPREAWEHWWKSPDAEVSQFFGFDNGFFFVAFLPAVLIAYDAGIRLPRALITNEFYQLAGQKFSTSRAHAIWGDEALARIDADVLRYYLGHDRPEHAQTSFTLAGLRQRVAVELVGEWDAWLGEVHTRLGQGFGYAVPTAEAYSAEQADFHDRLRGLVRDLAESYGAASFSLRRASRLLSEWVATAREFGQAHAHGRAPAGASVGGTEGTAVALELAAVRAFAVVVSPLMPAFGARLLKALGEEGAKPRWDATVGLLPGERVLSDIRVGGFASALVGIDALQETRGREVLDARA